MKLGGFSLLSVLYKAFQSNDLIQAGRKEKAAGPKSAKCRKQVSRCACSCIYCYIYWLLSIGRNLKAVCSSCFVTFPKNLLKSLSIQGERYAGEKEFECCKNEDFAIPAGALPRMGCGMLWGVGSSLTPTSEFWDVPLRSVAQSHPMG